MYRPGSLVQRVHVTGEGDETFSLATSAVRILYGFLEQYSADGAMLAFQPGRVYNMPSINAFAFLFTRKSLRPRLPSLPVPSNVDSDGLFSKFLRGNAIFAFTEDNLVRYSKLTEVLCDE